MSRKSSSPSSSDLVVKLKRMQKDHLVKMLKKNKNQMPSSAPDDDNLFSRMAAADFCPRISETDLEHMLIYVPPPEIMSRKRSPSKFGASRRAVKQARLKASTWMIPQGLTKFVREGSTSGAEVEDGGIFSKANSVCNVKVEEETEKSIPVTPEAQETAPTPPDPEISHSRNEDGEANSVPAYQSSPASKATKEGVVMSMGTAEVLLQSSSPDKHSNSRHQEPDDIVDLHLEIEDPESPTVDVVSTPQPDSLKEQQQQTPKPSRAEALTHVSGNQEITPESSALVTESAQISTAEISSAEKLAKANLEQRSGSNPITSMSSVVAAIPAPAVSTELANLPSQNVSVSSHLEARSSLPVTPPFTGLPPPTSDASVSFNGALQHSLTSLMRHLPSHSTSLATSSGYPPSSQGAVSSVQLDSMSSTLASPSSSLPALACFMKFPNSKFSFWNALVCRFCGFPKSSPEELEAHIAWDHWNWIPFQCCYCPSVFRPTQYTLRLHLQEVHPSQPHKKSSNSTILSTNEPTLSLTGPATIQKPGPLPPPASNGQEKPTVSTASSREKAPIGKTQQTAKSSVAQKQTSGTAAPAPILDESEKLSETIDNVVASARKDSSKRASAAPTPTSGSTITTIPIARSQNADRMALPQMIQQKYPSTPAIGGQRPMPAPVASPVTGRNAVSELARSKARQLEMDNTARRNARTDIQCQECSTTMPCRQENVHGHVYEHMHKKGFGYRYTCGECGFGCIRKFEYYAHNRSAHGNGQMKLRDRSQEMNPMFLGITHKLDDQFVKHEVSQFSMEWNLNVKLSNLRKLCFPSFDPGTLQVPLICGVCRHSVPRAKKNEHIYRMHLNKPLVKCGYCGFTMRSMAYLKQHTKTVHLGAQPKPESLLAKHKREILALREQCFGDISSQCADVYRAESSSSARSDSPEGSQGAFGGVGADEMMSGSGSPEEEMEVECGFGNGFAKEDDYVLDDDVVVITG